MKTTQLIIKEIKAPAIVTKALAVKVIDQKSLTLSAEYLTSANQSLDALTEDKKKLTDPLNQSLKAIRAKYKPVEDILNEVIDHLRSEQSAYATSIEQAKKEAEAKITKRMEAGTLGVEKALTKLESLETVAPVVTENGGLTFRPKATLKIVDASLIPRTYLLPDEALILKELQDGVVVPGCVIEIIQVPYNKR